MIFNILLMGNTNTGKRQLMIRFTNDIFEEYNSSTIGVEFKDKEIEINNKTNKTFSKNFIKKIDDIIFVFDLANEYSFNLIKECLIINGEDIINYQRILVG